MAQFKIRASSLSPSSSITNANVGDYLAHGSCSPGTHKRKCRQQETNNISSLLDSTSYPNETNVCLHLSLAFCNCIQVAKKQKLVHQETNVCHHLSLSCCNCTQIAEEQKLTHQETNVSTKNNTCNDVDVDVAVDVGTCSDSSTSRDDPWKIKKVLTISDLGNHSRLLLKKELAKKWVVPFLDKVKAEKDGIKVPVFDVDTQSLRSLVFKVWPSNGSHVFIDTWIKDFVNERNLKAGDEIGFKWDKDEKKFDFSVLRRC